MKKNIVFLSLIVTNALHAKIVIVENENDYKKNVVDNNNPLIIKFSADWCSVCNNVARPFEEISNEPEFSGVTFIQVDVDKLDSVSKQNGIVGVPTFIYRNNGIKIVEEIGVQNMSEFKNNLRQNLRTNFKATTTQTTPDSTVAPAADVVEEQIAITTDEAAAQPEQSNAFMQILKTITALLLAMLMKIKDFFMMIINTIKGFFGN